MYNDYDYRELQGFKSVPHQVMDNLTEFKEKVCESVDKQTETQKEVGEQLKEAIKAQTQSQVTAMGEIKTAVKEQTNQQREDARQNRETQTSLFSNLVNAIKAIPWKV